MKPVPRVGRCAASHHDIFVLVVGHDFFGDSTITHPGTRRLDLEACRRLWADPEVRRAVRNLHHARGPRPHRAKPWAEEMFGDDDQS